MAAWVDEPRLNAEVIRSLHLGLSQNLAALHRRRVLASICAAESSSVLKNSADLHYSFDASQ
jgi:hypothetical protein